MKNQILLLFCILASTLTLSSQDLESIKLPEPNLKRGVPLMQAFSQRASSKDFKSENMKLEDISDLLWAANGINRPGDGKRTSPSAQNAQDIDIYVFLKKGVFIYNADEHQLDAIKAGDYRSFIAGRQKDVSSAALMLLLVSDISRFKFGEEHLRKEWGAMDAGIVSQNISLFCASEGFANRPRASMDDEKLIELLNLTESQYLMMNNVISYK